MNPPPPKKKITIKLKVDQSQKIGYITNITFIFID